MSPQIKMCRVGVYIIIEEQCPIGVKMAKITRRGSLQC
jgi:hypothetical protein